MKLVRVSIFLICVVAALAGCGGGGGDDTTISKAEFVKRADAICTEAMNKRAAAFRADLDARKDPYTNKEFQAVMLDVLLPPLAIMADELEELGETAAEPDRASAIGQAFREGVDKVEAEPAKVMAAEISPFAKALKMAREFGLEACGSIS